MASWFLPWMAWPATGIGASYCLPALIGRESLILLGQDYRGSIAPSSRAV